MPKDGRVKGRSGKRERESEKSPVMLSRIVVLLETNIWNGKKGKESHEVSPTFGVVVVFSHNP
jgi:hypothetical protein